MPQTSPCPDVERLRQFALGQIAEEEAGLVEQHLARCARCLATLGSLETDDVLVESLRARTTVVEAARADGAVPRLIAQLKGLAQVPAGPVSAGEAAHELYGFLAPPQAPDELGRLGPYRVLKVLGFGGMGVVFEAEDTLLRRPVALKVVRPALGAGASARQRFLREARAMATVSHPHVVTIYQVGEVQGVPFLAMELLPGESLESRLSRRGPLPIEEVRRLGAEIAEGLAAARRHGVPRQDPRLRAGAGAERRGPPEPPRDCHRHAALHGAGAGAGRAGRPPGGPVQPRQRPVRLLHRPAAVPRRHQPGRAAPRCRGRAPARPRVEPGRSRLAGGDHCPAARQGPRRALSVGGRGGGGSQAAADDP